MPFVHSVVREFNSFITKNNFVPWHAIKVICLLQILVSIFLIYDICLEFTNRRHWQQSELFSFANVHVGGRGVVGRRRGALRWAPGEWEEGGRALSWGPGEREEGGGALKWAPQLLLARRLLPLRHILLVTHRDLFRLVAGEFDVAANVRGDAPLVAALTKQWVDCLLLIPPYQQQRNKELRKNVWWYRMKCYFGSKG